MSAEDTRKEHNEDELKAVPEDALDPARSGRAGSERKPEAGSEKAEQAEPQAQSKQPEDDQGDREAGELEALQGQVAEQRELVLRTQAEMQNVRRRAEIDVDKARKFALEKFVKELLPIADSLEKAVESTEGKTSSDEVVASIREGAEMTLNLFMNSLEKFNVKQVNPVGEPFDPQLHEAMSMVPAPDAEPNSVVACIQKGYTLNERLVRPAMVVVARPDDSAKIDEQA
ncbi:nucleotide exchange factor GrpE [Marinobacter fonticola]|uniref:nucleotide exchange factor GrpE n=1 Tax=Marinobacter fonticola TaxID=2603215 RepID=UPI0011E7B751|nr:nucleotide exchange factor GrpE [Marinobacter fonticola]